MLMLLFVSCIDLLQSVNSVVTGCRLDIDNSGTIADGVVESSGGSGGGGGGGVNMDESDDDAGDDEDDDEDDSVEEEEPTGIIVGTGNSNQAEMARKVKSMLRESARVYERDEVMMAGSGGINSVSVNGEDEVNKLDEDIRDVGAGKYMSPGGAGTVNHVIGGNSGSGGGSGGGGGNSTSANSKRKRKNVASCVMDFGTFLKYVMTKHKYLLYHDKPITRVDPSLFYEDIDKLKLDSNNKLKLMQQQDVAFNEYNVNKHNSSNHQRMLLVQSLAIALERKNVTVLYSISYLKFMLATFSTFVKAEHFIHVQHELPSLSLAPAQQQAQESGSMVMKSVATNHNPATMQQLQHQQQKQIFGGGGRHNRNQAKLSSGAILYDYAKNYSNFAVAVSKATRNDLEGLNYMRINRMILNRSILNILLLKVAHKLVETRDRCMRPDHVAVNITQMKHMFICVTAYLYCVWEEDRFVLPAPSLERDIGSDALNDVKLDGHYAILEVAVGHGMRIIIDVLETSHAGLAADTRLPYCERIARFCNYFGPKWSAPSNVEHTMDSHSAYVQLPIDAVSPAGGSDVSLERYYHAKPLHTVCAFGLCGPDVLIAYHRGNNEFEYKLMVPNNTTLNITFMVMRFDTVKRAVAAGVQASAAAAAAASPNEEQTDSDVMPPPSPAMTNTATSAATTADVLLIDDVLTYRYNPGMRIHEFGQVLAMTENRHPIILFHQPLKVTIYETVKLCGCANTDYTHINEFRPPQARENAGALRKRSYFENAIATCSEEELRDQLMKRFKTADDLQKFMQQALGQQ